MRLTDGLGILAPWQGVDGEATFTPQGTSPIIPSREKDPTLCAERTTATQRPKRGQVLRVSVPRCGEAYGGRGCV